LLAAHAPSPRFFSFGSGLEGGAEDGDSLGDSDGVSLGELDDLGGNGSLLDAMWISFESGAYGGVVLRGITRGLGLAP
jgi:hypothetical protein